MQQKFEKEPNKVPRLLDPVIEKYFSTKQQSNRLKLFLHLTDPDKRLKMTEKVILSASKVNHGRFTNEYRGSLYRGVSRNGKSWQVLIMIDSEKIYLCTTDNPHMAAKLYDYVIIQAKGLSSKLNFSYTKSELLAILFEQSIVEVKKQKLEHDKIEQQKMFNIQYELIKKQRIPQRTPYFLITKQYRPPVSESTLNRDPIMRERASEPGPQCTGDLFNNSENSL